MIIQPFTPEHLDHLDIRSFEAKELEFAEDIRRSIVVLPDCFTGIEAGQVVAIAGIYVIWPGVADAFVISTPLVEKYPKAFHRAILRGLLHLCQKRHIRRLQTAVHVDHKVSRKWIKRLGFRPEGLMRAYGPDGSDYIRYARIWQEEK